MINKLIIKAKQKAWAKLATHPEVMLLQSTDKLVDASIYNRKRGKYKQSNTQYERATQLLEMKNK